MRSYLLVLLMLIVVPSMAGQTKRALLVGISSYGQTGPNSWTAIHGANDVDLISPTLKKQGFKVTMLQNKNATAARIRKALASLISSVRPGDMVYLHFSCHGQPFEDLDGDEEDGWDESIIPYDAQLTYRRGIYEGANHIKDDELHNYIDKMRKAVGPKGYVCVVIDACHAGSASRGEDEFEDENEETFVRGVKKPFSPNGKQFRPRINAKSHFRITQHKGYSDIVILEACRSYQSNYEIKQSGKFFGPLSYYVNLVLSKQRLTRGTDWVLEVNKRMSADKRLARQNMVYETSLE